METLLLPVHLLLVNLIAELHTSDQKENGTLSRQGNPTAGSVSSEADPPVAIGLALTLFYPSLG